MTDTKALDEAVRREIAEGPSKVEFRMIFGEERMVETPAVFPHFADRVRAEYRRIVERSNGGA